MPTPLVALRGAQERQHVLLPWTGKVAIQFERQVRHLSRHLSTVPRDIREAASGDSPATVSGCPTSPSPTSPTPIPAAICCSRRRLQRLARQARRADRRQRRRQDARCCASSRASSRPRRARSSVGGRGAYMPQDVGAGPTRPDRPRPARRAGARARCGPPASACSRPSARWPAGDDAAGMDLGDGIGEWSELGGYELEGQWDAACRRIVRAPFADDRGPAGADALRRRAQAARARPAVRLRRRRAPARRARQLPRRPRQARARGADRDDEEDRPADLPRPRAAHRPPSTRSSRWRATAPGCTAAPTRTYPEARERAPEAARRRGEALERRGAPALQADEDVQGAGELQLGLGEEGRRDGDALAALRRARARRPRRWSTSRSACACAAATPRAAWSTCDGVGIEGLVQPFSDEIHFGERVGLSAPTAPARRS